MKQGTKIKIKNSDITGVVIDSDEESVRVQRIGIDEVLTVSKDIVEVVGFVRIIINFLIELFRPRPLPLGVEFMGKKYLYYSYMDGGQFVAGYKFEDKEDKRFRIKTPKKGKTRRLLRRTLREYYLL